MTKCWNYLSFVNITPTLIIDTTMERFLRILQHENAKIWFFFQKSSKFEFWFVTKCWDHLSFVNISPTLVIDTSMDRSYFHKYYNMETQKYEVSAVMFCKQFLAYAVHNDHKHSSRSQHVPIWRHRGCIVVRSRVDI